MSFSSVLSYFDATEKIHSKQPRLTAVTNCKVRIAQTVHRAPLFHCIPLRTAVTLMMPVGVRGSIHKTQLIVLLSVKLTEISELTCDVSAFEDAAHTAWPVSPSKLERIKQETSTDHDLQVVSKLITHGWPKHAASVPVQAKVYHQWGNSLSTSKGLLLEIELLYHIV